MSSALPHAPPAARRGPSGWGEASALAATAVIAAIDSGDGLLRGLRALVDTRGSNIGDPWPAVVAAGRLASAFQAPVYDDFNLAGASFIYPPLAALPFTPFASLGFEGAHAALSVVSRAAWLACVVLAAMLAWNPRRRLVSGAFVAVAAFGFYPLLRSVELDQATLFVAVALGVAFLLAERARERGAGAAVAVATAFKPQLVFVLGFGAWRSRRMALGGALTLASLGVASLVYAGLHDHVRYVTTVLPAVSAGYAFYPNQSWSGTFQRLAGMPAFDFVIAPPPAPIRLAATLASGVTLLVGLWAARRAARAGRPGDLALHLAFAWTIVTLASPISWEHHYAPAIFVFAILLRRSEALPADAVALACAAFPLVAGFIDVRGFHGMLGRLAMSYVMLGGILLAAALWRAIAPGRAASVAGAG